MAAEVTADLVGARPSWASWLRSNQTLGWALCVVAAVVALALPSFASIFLIGIATTTAIYMVLSYSVAIIYWSTGGIHFGIAAISMFAAYVVVVGTAHGWPLLVAELVAIVGSGLASALLAPFFFRLRGIYFAIMTFAVASLLSEIAGDVNITGGQQGLTFVPLTGPVPGLTTDTNQVYRDAVIIAILVALVTWVYRRSTAGRRGVALNNDEVLGRSLGINLWRYQITASLFGGMLAGIGGVLFVFSLGYVSPGEFDVSVSLGALTALIVGGQRFVLAPVIGCLVVILIPDALNAGGFWNAVIYAGSLIAVVLIVPDGLLGLINGDRRRALWRRAIALRSLRIRDNVATAGDKVPHPVTPQAQRQRAPIRAEGHIEGEAAGRVGTLTEPTAAPPEPVAAGGPPAVAGIRVASSPGAGDESGNGSALRAEHITVRYGGVVAVRDVSLTVPSGQVVGLIGANGSGKSTIVNAMTGLATRHAGHVWIDGQEANERDVSSLAIKGLRRTFQGVRIFPWLTVGQHLEVVTRAASTPDDDAGRHFRAHMLEILGMPAVAQKRPSDLPYGSQRLLGLALAVSSLPKYLLLDEPTSGLHQQEGERVGECISMLAAAGIGLLVIDHNMEFMVRVAPTSLALHAGSLIAEGPTSQVLQSDEVRKVYLGE